MMNSTRPRVGVVCSLLLVLTFFLSAHAAPLNYNVIDPSRHGQTHETDKDIAALHQATEHANHQIDRMHHVVENHHKPYNHLVLTKAFGKNYNIHEIKHNVGLLKSSTVNVATVRHDLGGANAKTSKPDGHLHFDHKYYTGKTDRERAGTLIHEASHSLFNTHDHFTNHADPSKIRAISSGEKRRLEEAQLRDHKAAKKEAGRLGRPIPKSKDLPPVSLTGYVKKSDYNTLKAKASHVMHHNADAYKVLGHLSTYGLLAPMDKDKGRRHPLVDNKGIPSKIVKNGGSRIPISTKRLSDKQHPVINPYTSKPMGMPKKLSKHESGSNLRAHSSGSHPPSKIPVHGQLDKIRKEKAKALYSKVAHGAHENHHILQAGEHAKNSRRKDVVREKPLPPLPHEVHHPSHQSQAAHHTAPASQSHSHQAAHSPHHATPASQHHSHQGSHPPHSSTSKPPAHRAQTPKRPSSPPRGPRPMSPAKRPSSPNQKPHKH